MGWELITSFILGALHNLEPGHGKTAMLAMMLDPKKKWLDLLSLAVSSVVSHSALILAIAILTHFGGHFLFGEGLDKFLINNIKFFGSVSLMLIGLFLLWTGNKPSKVCCDSISLKPEGRAKLPILLGISIGLYPCPTLVATFLASISTGQLNHGVIAVCLFALGSFVSILASAYILKWIGTKLAGRLSSRLSKFNWKKLQGAVVLLVGVGTLVSS